MERFIRFEVQGKISYGVLNGDRVKVATGDVFSNYEVGDRSFSLDEINILTPSEPSKVVGIGLNYKDAVIKNNLKTPSEPVVFLKPPTTIIGDNEDIIYPELSKIVSYEVELGVLIGRKARNVSKEDALDYVFGYFIANDLTAKDLLGKNGPWTVGKGFDTFTPVSSCIVRGVDPSNLRISMKQNGVVTQDSNTNQMIFDVPSIINYVSSVMTLMPGDIILTGTPAGASELKVGDVLEGEIENIGTLKNKVAGGK